MSKSKLIPHIVNIKVLVYHTPSDPHSVFYSVCVGKLKPAGFFANRLFKKNVIGKTHCTSLIFALTQDAVLEAISPVKGVIR